ncbi:hypothetical protein Amsp01_035470 [Amycolatopsis sp. NBRC 101858]|uniref:hypothetical protein n=1 Tax=Amycolatopsis sp. NBRC 101858 TaxID=3032200 RepID=UPI0024A160CC|nr:hypothetical protein [Amycolatopsis sp. NBRC 101858]GLY37523.1 hypothetical protein Amsp01_035470 [Amycolatopsis sp. NBRC 101858]
MNWAVILPLVGVLIGATASFAAQYLATRTTQRQEKIRRVAEIRAERKEVIFNFLEGMQLVERVAEHRFEHGGHGEVPQPATHRMWYLQKCIELVGTQQLIHASVEYAQRLHDAVYGSLPAGVNVWEFMAERRFPFLEAARRELDIPDLRESGST